MMTARGVRRALVCSGAAAVATLAVLQGGALLTPTGPQSVALTGEALSFGNPPAAHAQSFGRILLAALPLLWTLAILWGALSTWLLRRLPSQSVWTYLNAAVFCGGGLGLLGLGSVRWMVNQPIPPARAAIVMAAFILGWVTGLGGYWWLKRREAAA
jgi:hypothetical protein